MSGGYFDYNQYSIADNLFPSLSLDYGEDGHEQSKKARKMNPMRDRDISELVWDTLCLLHSFDWCESGDTCEETYQADVEWFKDKWLRRTYRSRAEKAQEDIPDPVNTDRVIKGGTGYCISLKDGKEVYDKSTDHKLPDEIEHTFPDYSLYPRYNYAVCMTSRGCPRQCRFCHVAAKEGCRSVKVANVSDFWNGQKEIQVCDPNILACKDKRDLLGQYRETGARIDFNQGLDIRLMNEADMEDLHLMRIKNMHFAWDNPNDDLSEKFKDFSFFGGVHGRVTDTMVRCTA